MQELWILNNELHIHSNMENDFEDMGTSDIDACSSIFQGRPYGGVGVLVYSFHCWLYDNRFIGVECLYENTSLLSNNVYLCCNYDSYIQ